MPNNNGLRAVAGDWNGQQRQLIHAIRLQCPRGQPLPDKVRTVVAYLFKHRSRLRYHQFRQAGYPIGSGTVESACKLLMQAGMRWSRDGTQAMLALLSLLLSDCCDEVWLSFRPTLKLT